MKRINIIGLFAVLWMVSCTKQDLPTADNAINFATNEAFTRGTPIASATHIPNMAVYGYYTGNGTANNWASKGATATPNFLDGITVTNNGGTWSYDNPVYWPQAANANVTFFAYSPVASTANGIVITNTTATPTLSYTVPTICTAQPDLLVAMPLTNLNKINNGTKSVNFTFSHALTCIGFKVAGDGYKLKSVTVTGVLTSSALKMDANNMTWSTPTTPADFTAGLKFDSGQSYHTTTATMSDVLDTNGYLMMIPQTLGTDAKIILSFEDVVDLVFPINATTWVIGKKMVYNITIKAKPEFEVTIEDWVGKEINVEY